VEELEFKAPDAGVWEQDGTHAPRPATRFMQEAFPEGFVKGFQMGTSRYGLLLDHLEPAFVNGFCYYKAIIVGAPKNAKGGPPPKPIFKLISMLHPETRRRLARAATVLEEKPWREHLRNWDTVLKPQSTRNHLRLQAVDLASLSDAQLADHLEECFENSKAMALQHHIYTISCGIPMGDFMACTQEWTGLPPSDIAQILRGSTPISCGVTDEYLAALDVVGRDEAAAAILECADQPGEKLRKLRALPGDSGKILATYLDLVAHRVVGGYDISCPTAMETPETLVQSLQATYSREAQERAERRVAEQTATIRSAVPEPHRALFDEILAEARLVNRLRDERSYWSDLWSSGISRRALLEAGRRLAAKGTIRRAEDALDASCGEAVALLSGKRDTPSAEELASRHDYRNSIPNDAPPPFLNGKPGSPPPNEWFPPRARRTMRAMDAFLGHLFGGTTRTSEAAIVRGISVSQGSYEGTARVIEKMDELGQIRKGEILVTRSTSTAFNYVLPLVGAIVTDRGGLMSHAALVAREDGLPGVVGCMVATKLIPNGARVRVDADKGEVVVLS
jgi:rifampicin phosphotransferase